jgi:hypothetical protein
MLGCAVWLLEIETDGYVVRDVRLDRDGTPRSFTRPGDYGVWTDGAIPVSHLMTSTDPRSFGVALRRFGSEIGRDEFELAYARAAASLPDTLGRTAPSGNDFSLHAAMLAVIALAAGFALIVARSVE